MAPALVNPLRKCMSRLPGTLIVGGRLMTKRITKLISRAPRRPVLPRHLPLHYPQPYLSHKAEKEQEKKDGPTASFPRLRSSFRCRRPCRHRQRQLRKALKTPSRHKTYRLGIIVTTPTSTTPTAVSLKVGRFSRSTMGRRRAHQCIGIRSTYPCGGDKGLHDAARQRPASLPA